MFSFSRVCILAFALVLCLQGCLPTANLLAGQPEVTESTSGQGSKDGFGSMARLSGNYSIAIDNKENIYIAERDRIRKVSPEGNVTTFIQGNHKNNLIPPESSLNNVNLHGLTSLVIQDDILYFSGINCIRYLDLKQSQTEALVKTWYGKCLNANNEAYSQRESPEASINTHKIQQLRNNSDEEQTQQDKPDISSFNELTIDRNKNIYATTDDMQADIYYGSYHVRITPDQQLIKLDYTQHLIRLWNAPEPAVPFLAPVIEKNFKSTASPQGIVYLLEANYKGLFGPPALLDLFNQNLPPNKLYKLVLPKDLSPEKPEIPAANISRIYPQLTKITAMVTDSEDNLYVLDDKTIKRISPTGQISDLGLSPTLEAEPFYGGNNLAINPAKNILYITNDTGIYRLPLPKF